MKTILVWAINTLINENWEVNQEIESMLKEFENNKIVVANADESEMSKLWLSTLDYEVFSLAHEPNKINPLYFDILLKTYNLLPKDAVYFDASEEAVQAAWSMWITSYKFHKGMNINALNNYLKINLFIAFFWSMCVLEIFAFVDVMQYW